MADRVGCHRIKGVRLAVHLLRLAAVVMAGFVFAMAPVARAQNPATSPASAVSAAAAVGSMNAFKLVFSHREAPSYPEMMQRRHIEARVFSEIQVNPDCSMGAVNYLGVEVSEGTISSPFTDAIGRAVKEWKPVCNSIPANGLRVSQEFVFGAGYSRMSRYKWIGNTVELTQALSYMEAPFVTKAPIDVRTLDCPLLVKVRMLMPRSPNRVTGFPNDGHPLDVWLKGLTFQRQYRLDLVGERIAIHIPCSIIDIR